MMDTGALLGLELSEKEEDRRYNIMSTEQQSHWLMTDHSMNWK